MIKIIKYKISGMVYGEYWGSGEGAYEMVKLHGKYLKVILKNAEKNLQELDSGMGYENVLGAILYIEKITSINIKGVVYSRSDYDCQFIGKLTEKQMNFLTDIRYE